MFRNCFIKKHTSDITAAEICLLPVFQQRHWSLLVLDKHTKTAYHYDSLYPLHMEVAKKQLNEFTKVKAISYLNNLYVYVKLNINNIFSTLLIKNGIMFRHIRKLKLMEAHAVSG